MTIEELQILARCAGLQCWSSYDHQLEEHRVVLDFPYETRQRLWEPDKDLNQSMYVLDALKIKHELRYVIDSAGGDVRVTMFKNEEELCARTHKQMARAICLACLEFLNMNCIEKG